ncbi:methyl-accepting chemotaxis protein [Rhizomicrobium palustre]|uniref:Methyl-accepting chemotaxis protein n=1 Tax=Rhizomicrobium palustre TaxID=189966 RepID=A0A846N1Z4_9PROT|nr:methyl-accepting chemotaxis protein [Rhizomicrobium palustre]NIK89633.1 methyl-accepting chemotaxis protein [Rhizomicrobium palustre]
MRFTIKLKLGLGFGITLLLLLASAYFAISSLASMNDSVDAMVAGPVDRLSTAKQVRADLLELIRNEKNIILETDPGARRGFDSNIAKTRAALDADIEHGLAIASEQGKPVYRDVLSNWQQLKPLDDKLRGLALEGKTQEATVISSSEMRQLSNEMLKGTTQLVAFSEDAMKEAGNKLDENETRARTVLITIVAIAFLLATAAAAWVMITVGAGLRRITEATETVASGDLTQTLQVKNNDEVRDVVAKVNQMVERLRGVVGDAIAAANNVSAGSQELSATAEEMSQGATEQSSAAEEASASMEEMASNIKQNADNASQTEKISKQSAHDAEASGAAVSKAVDAMRTIAEKITIVQEIARQTDLLALNAAVEAARAGEHGKGFAVVASEVRKLAERSQTAATEISTLSSDTVKAAQTAGEMLAKLVPDIRKTAELVSEISAACREQDIGAAQINEAIQQLDKVTQQNAAASEQMSSTSEELASQAEEMQASIAYFRTSNSTAPAQATRNRPASRSKTDFKTQKPSVAEQQLRVRGFALDMSGRDDKDDGFREYG